MLREDNADARLTETGRELGLVDDARWAHFSENGADRERASRLERHPASTRSPKA